MTVQPISALLQRESVSCGDAISAAAGFAAHRPAEPKLRVLVVDDTPNMLQLLVAVIECQRSLTVVGTAADGAAALAAAERLRPEVVVLDVAMPVMNGLLAAPLLRALRPSPRILMTSADNDDDLQQACLDAGADAFLFKGDFATGFRPCLLSLFAAGQTSLAGAESPRI